MEGGLLHWRLGIHGVLTWIICKHWIYIYIHIRAGSLRTFLDNLPIDVLFQLLDWNSLNKQWKVRCTVTFRNVVQLKTWCTILRLERTYNKKFLITSQLPSHHTIKRNCITYCSWLFFSLFLSNSWSLYFFVLCGRS